MVYSIQMAKILVGHDWPKRNTSALALFAALRQWVIMRPFDHLELRKSRTRDDNSSTVRKTAQSASLVKNYYFTLLNTIPLQIKSPPSHRIIWLKLHSEVFRHDLVNWRSSRVFLTFDSEIVTAPLRIKKHRRNLDFFTAWANFPWNFFVVVVVKMNNRTTFF